MLQSQTLWIHLLIERNDSPPAGPEQVGVMLVSTTWGL